jgi:PKD repeat protein
MMAFASVATATTIVVPTDDQLIAKSPVIVEATVVSSNTVARGDEIWTETKLAIQRTLKGKVTGEVTVREIGGQLDNRITKIYGSPEYVVGENVLAFLTATPRGDYQTTDLFIGKFSEDRALSGRKLWMREAAMANVTLLDANFEPIQAKNVQRDGTGFETFVANRVAGKTAEANYGLENPLLASEILPARRSPQQPIVGNFTMIAEPNIYRWYAFERGQTVRWYSHGTQPGYTGGGVSEVSAAMEPWNNASGARISYSYSGAGTGTPGGLSARNGVNEVLFNDPKSEISGSWDRTTGGVVGQGGFNGTGSSASWSSPFAADASHPQRTYQAVDIIEGNLTIQDNVSPANGIQSARLAEIIAHEFGHTLGFGHSTDGGALMYPSITGRGPTLGPDDLQAAQWLYPNGTTPTTPTTPSTVPVAPGNLAGSSSQTVNGPIISLNWTDNSSNETGFYFYVSPNGLGFSRVTQPAGAGTTAASLTGATAGTYQIYIKAFNAVGESPASNTVTVTVTAPVAAYFTFTPNTGIAGVTTFAFTDMSTGPITSRLWTFGDGTTSTQTNPTKLYASAGSYSVTLRLNQGLATEATYSQWVTANGSTAPQTPSVQAAFDLPTSGLVAGNALSFTDRSTGSPVAWTWSFGDSTLSNAQNPTKTYFTAGTYTVTLTAQSASSSSTMTKTITIADKNALLLNNSRYRVTINARDQRTGKTATGQATLQTSEFGYFSLPELTGNANNPEVFVKVLGPVGGVPWVFFGGLTDVEYTLTVTDTQTNVVRTYYHAPGDAKGGYDTGGGQGPAGVCAANAIAEDRTSLNRATSTQEQLSMLNSRFGMSLVARDPRTGQTAAGITIPVNDESGFFTLPALTGNAGNIEVFVKIVNATSVDGHNWVFFGGLTDFEYTLTVADTQTGKVRRYTKPAGSACGGFDTTGF